MLELALLPAGAALLAFCAYTVARDSAGDHGLSRSTLGAVCFLVAFLSLAGGGVWSELGPFDPHGPAATRRAVVLLPTLAVAAALGVRSGLRKRRRPLF